MTDIEVTLETQTILVPPITQTITLDESDTPTILVPPPVSVSVISAGPQGPPGNQGPQGVQGIQGVPGVNDKKINFVFTTNPNIAVDALTADPDDLCVDSWNRWWGIEHTPPADPAWVPLNSDLRTQHVLGDAADLNVGTTAGTVAAGDHTHPDVYVNTSGDTMTGALQTIGASVSAVVFGAKVAGDTETRLEINADGGLAFGDGVDTDKATVTTIGSAEGWPQPIIKISPSTAGQDSSAIVLVEKTDGGGTDNIPYTFMGPGWIEMYMGGTTPESYGCIDFWTTDYYGTNSLPRIIVYGGVDTTPEPLLLVGTGANAELVKIWNTGDIEITNSTRGIILMSPDLTRWRITVGDDGALSTEAL